MKKELGEIRAPWRIKEIIDHSYQGVLMAPVNDEHGFRPH